MSLYTNQVSVNSSNYFFLLANVSTLRANEIIAKNISTNSITGGTANFSTVTGIRGIFNDISCNTLEANSISSLNLETNFAEMSSLVCLDGLISSILTTNVILDGNTLDTGGAGAGAVLLLNGFPIVTGGLSSFSTLADWSYFPALSSVNFANQNILQAGNINCQNIFNALNVQTDSASILTSLTAPSGVITNLRNTNFSTVSAVGSNITVSQNLLASNISTGTINGQSGTFRGLSSLTLSTGTVTAGSLSTNTLSTGTINGVPFISGSNWSQYPANSVVNLANNTLSNTSNIVGTQIAMTVASNIGLTASNDINMAATDLSATIDGGINIADIATVNITAQNGNRGRINLTANSGFNNGVAGDIFITANGGSVLGVGTGGTIELTANTPIGLSNLTSKISLSASGINSYAGVVPPLASAFGYNFIYGTNGVYLAAGIPPGLPNVPGTCYIYGTLGIEMPSDLYLKNIYPYWDGITTPPDINIEGRYIIPNLAQVCVRMSNVRQIDFQSNVTTYMSNCDNIAMSANGVITTSNLSATNGTIGTLSNTTIVGAGGNISGYNTISATNGSFTTLSNTNIVGAGSGQINGYVGMSTLAMNLSSINGFASFGSKSIRVSGDVAQVQCYNNNPGGIGTNLNLLSRVAYTEIQSFNSNFTDARPLVLRAGYISTGDTFYMNSTIMGSNLNSIAGVRQPFIQYSTIATTGGSGNQQVELPVYYADSNYIVQVTMKDTSPAQLSVDVESQSSFSIYWGNAGGGAHDIGWTSFGNL